jgi:hypothetical protein
MPIFFFSAITNDPYLNELNSLEKVMRQFGKADKMPWTISSGMKAINKKQPFTPREYGGGKPG